MVLLQYNRRHLWYVHPKDTVGIYFEYPINGMAYSIIFWGEFFSRQNFTSVSPRIFLPWPNLLPPLPPTSCCHQDAAPKLLLPSCRCQAAPTKLPLPSFHRRRKAAAAAAKLPRCRHRTVIALPAAVLLLPHCHRLCRRTAAATKLMPPRPLPLPLLPPPPLPPMF